MHTRPVPPRWRALAAALVLGTAACADQVTAPAPARTAPGAASASTATLTRPTLVSNQTRYRWNGARPVTGRSGSAVLTTRALIDREGKTELEMVSSSSLDPWWYGSWPRGNIANVQVKGFDAQGKLLATRNQPNVDAGPVTTLSFGGFHPGATLQVQALVRELDGRRTHVVTVADTVRRRPNLAVTRVSAPARTRVGTVVNITATVAETNGDVGAYAQCILYENGVQADWAWWVWVDAGDAVTCAFARRSDREGTRNLEVRLADISPRDDDPRDNAASATLEAVFDGDLLYVAQVSDNEWRYHDFWSGHWAYGAAEGSEWRYERRYDERRQTARFSAWIPRVVASPRLEVDERTGGRAAGSAAFDFGPILWYGWGCGYGVDEATGAYAYLCTEEHDGGRTSFSYERNAGSVTYHSSDYSRYWYGGSEEYVYSYNDSGSSAWGTLAELGADYTFDVRLTDGGQVYPATATLALGTWGWDSEWPLSCWEYDDEWSDYSSSGCSQYESHYRWTEGSATNYDSSWWGW